MKTCRLTRRSRPEYGVKSVGSCEDVRNDRLPPRKAANGLKWISKINLSPKDQDEGFKAKAKLCGRGFSQVERMDFTWTFVPKMKYDTL